MDNQIHTDGETTKAKSPQNNLIAWWTHGPLTEQTKKAALVAVIFFLVLLAIGFMASRSLPGETLYGMKTGFLEGLQESVQFDAKSKATYQVKRMETRLAEIKKVSEKETVTQEEIDAFKQRVYMHQAKLTELVNLPDNKMTSPDILFVLSSFASVAAAIEGVTENTQGLESLGEEMEDVRRESVNLFSDRVDRFVERETPENIYAFITEQLQEVSRKLDNAELDDEVVDDAQVYINRVAPAVEENDFPRAILAVAEALRFIEVEEYGGRRQAENVLTPDTAPSESTGTSSEEIATTTPTDGNNGTFSFPQ